MVPSRVLVLVCTTPGFIYANDTGCDYLPDDVLAKAIEIQKGTIGVPKSPGLKVNVDEAKHRR